MDRILIGKVGFDGHDRGVKVVSQALKDAGKEVIYTGLHQSPEQVVRTAVQEDVDLIGISILSGAHMTLIPKVLNQLEKQNREDIPLMVGGIIPKEDEQELKQKGVREIFRPGTDLDTIVESVENCVNENPDR